MKTLTPKEIIEFIDSRLKGDVVPLDVESDAIQLIEQYAASQFQQKDVQPPEDVKELAKKAIDYQRQISVFGQAQADNALQMWMLGYQFKQQEPPAPSKTLQEMLEADFPMLSKEKWQELDLEDRPGKFFVDYLMIINERRNFCTKYYHPGQSSPSLSKELVEYMRERFIEMKELSRISALKCSSKKAQGSFKEQQDKYERFLTELNQLTNGK